MDRRAIKHAWRETAPDAGIYALRAGGEVRVGATMRLEATERRLHFVLRTGASTDRSLQAAFRETGAMTFEVLEAFRPDLGQMTRERLLKERAAHWRAALAAPTI